MTLGKRLRRLRLARGLSQKELAEPNYTHAYVSTIEADRRQPSRAALQYFATKLGVDVNELATGKPPGLEAEVELELQEARVVLAGGRPEEAERSFQKAGRKAGRYQLTRLVGKAEFGRALCAEHEGRITEALRLYERAEQILSTEPLTARVDVLAGRARCLQMLGDIRFAIHILESAVEVLERDGLADPSALLRLHASLVALYFEAGLPSKARISAEQALELASSVGDPERLGSMYLNVARVLLHDGRYRDAEESLRRAGDLFAQVDLKSDLASARLARGIAMSRRDERDAARREISAAAAIFHQTGSKVDEARATNELARVSRLEGNLEEAGELLAKSIEAMTDGGDIGVLAWAHRELALCVAPSDRARAETELRRAAELFERAEQPTKLAATYRLLGDLMAEGGDAGAGAEMYRAGLLAVEEPL